MSASLVRPLRHQSRLSMYARERIHHLLQGRSISATLRVLDNEGVSTCRQTVWRIRRHIHISGTAHPLPKSGRPTKLTAEVLQMIDDAMERDDEATATELVVTLKNAGITASRITILKGRRRLGWTTRGAAYCQMIRAVNREKCFRWAMENLNADFTDVIWTDETTIQLETHHRFCCRKRGQKPRYKPRPKHPVKVHVWAGISTCGATQVCIFEGVMDANLYVEILDGYLVPFVRRVYATGHRFMQDNDPKHTSRRAQDFFASRGINWWKTPSESPDANPIENLWHELKVSNFSIHCLGDVILCEHLEPSLHVDKLMGLSLCIYLFLSCRS